MTANTIRTALGVLQDEPDNEQAWQDLREAMGFTAEQGTVDLPAGADLGGMELAQLLEAARQAHEMRREYEAVAELLELEAAVSKHTGDGREPDLVAELAAIRDDILLDDAGALAAYRRLLALRPNDTTAEEAIERSEAKRAKWKDLATKYFQEAKSTGDASFKSSLLVSAAEIAYRYARPEILAKERKERAAKGEESSPNTSRSAKKKKKKGGPKAEGVPESSPQVSSARQELTEKIIGLLRDALQLDPKNRRAVLLQERLLREEERWEDLVTSLELFATESSAKDEKLAALIRLARVLKKKVGDSDRSVNAYERVLDLSPGHSEATSALVHHFTDAEMWDHLVSLYEGQLSAGGVRPGQEVGVILQIAMVNWKMRSKPEAAEAYFEKLRKWEPAHPGMLSFFREWCPKRSEQARLVQILTDAQRAMPDGPERGQLAAEIAGLAEEGANAQKAIEQWRTLLRSEPTNVAARDALKRLYRQTGAFNHLADLLRSELERIAPDDAKARLPVLRDIAQIYREHIKSDSALVTVLSQIIGLDSTDADAVRELARVYETLGRWRDLLTTQMRLAELEANTGAKAELYRAIARRWLDQFSNVQNAVEAFEKLREVEPDDREAVSKLKELYTKRRAYRQLYDLYEGETKRTEGAERRALWMEMAKMASDRLDRGADASRLYKLVLAEDPKDAVALDALEKQAERDKDFATVADALERRADLTDDPAAKLVVLQKLGTVYADRLQDHAGALRVWRRVLELSPGHAKALRILRDSYLAIGDYDGLTELYGQSSDWEGLVEVLSAAADRATDVTLKIDLSFRAAAIYENELKSAERAFRAYERVLSVRPDDRRAAAALVPLYEREEKWARLPSLYEVLLAHSDSEPEKRALYKKLAIVTGHKLADKAAAFRYAVKAFELAPAEPGAVRDLEEWARASGEWAGFVQALEVRSHAAGADYDERRALRLKLAEVSATHVGKSDDAIAAYRELVMTNEEDEEAIVALDRLLRAVPDRREDLRWLFRLRTNRAGTADAKVAILSEWALLEEEAFAAPTEAISLYREILGLDDRRVSALRALGRLLLASNDAEGAAAVLQKERDLEEGGSRVAREIELARLYMGPLKKPVEALAAAKRALEISPNDAHVIAVVEELLPLSETRARAAVILEAAYAATGAWQKQGDVLAVLIATAASKADRLALHSRLAEVKQKLGDHIGAFEVVARAAQDYPAELELWDRLSVLANKTHRTQQFVEAIAQAVPEKGESGLPQHVEIDLAERAATLYDEMLGEIDRATPYLDRILARDPGNERAFVRLKQILTTRERWLDLEALYERVLGGTTDANRRADLLNEVAIIAEEITGDANKAIHYYERILELEPGHVQAIYALDKLYASQERWQNLADLLQRRLSLAGSADTSTLKLRLGTLLMNRLGDPKAALNYLEEVVSADSSLRDARELVEKCLTHPDLRQRAAIILEGVYAEREEMRDLVRVLEVRLEFVADDVERRELLRRIAELRDERLTDDKGAFDAYGRLLPLSPGDVEARTRYLEIAARLDRLNDAADVVLVAAKNAESPQPRAELLSEVAKIYESSEESDRAEAIYRQVMDLAPDDPTIALPAVRALERIYMGSRSREKGKDLADVLRVQVKLEESVEIRRELYARLGKLAEEELKDDAAAISAWKSRLEDDPADEVALAALDRLYERSGEHRALVEVLRARERQADGPDRAASRKALMIRTAQTLGDRIADVPEAILAYRSVLDDFGADREVLGALEKLYEKAEQWPDYAETVEAELALATEDGDRIALLTKLGDVRRKRLSDVNQAIEAYRQALTLDPSGEPTRAARTALEELLDDTEARREAAEILRPLYEASGEDAKLVRVLDIQVENESSLEERLELYARASQVTEGPLADAVKAFGYAARALREAAADPAVTSWIERAERLTEKTGSHSDLVQLFRDVAPDVADEDQQVALTLRIAELARTKLADAALAKQYYKKALELRPDDTRALVALEELYEQAAEHEQLLEILKRRAEVAPDDAKKTEILYKEARVCDEALQDRDRAVSVYEEILELGMDDPAVAALERLYTASARWGDLVALHERELGATGEQSPSRDRRAWLHHALGRVHEKELGEIDRAFDEYAEALREDATHAATIASLEHLMTQKATAGRAAEMLEQVYLARLDWRKVMSAIDARLEGSEDPDERRTLLRRLAKLHEEQEENYKAALEVTSKLLAEDVTDEATWAELERLARVANAEDRLAEIFAGELDKITSDEPGTARLAYRTGELFEAQKNADRALHFYRRAYTFSPEEEQAAFKAIDRLLAQAAKPAERVALYRDALEYRTEPEQRITTLHAVAKIEEEELSDDEAAIATYRSILDSDETDARALDSLARLYTRRERFRDLADLHRRRAEQSALPEEEAKWRLALGHVLQEKLHETAAAIDELEAVLGLVGPLSSRTGDGSSQNESFRAAVTALEAMVDDADHRGRVVDLLRPIYERADDWRKLVDVAKHRFALATTPGEKVAVLRETARLLEERGTETDKAFDCLKEAFVLDPDDGDTREELNRLAVATSRWDDLADAYEKGIAKVDGIGQRELLEQLAKLHDKRRDDPRRALDAWDRYFRLDESDARPLDEMDQLATLLSDWPTLVRVLAKRAELTNDDEERASLWRRIGEARRDMLDDIQGSIDAYERALELEPTSAFTLDNMIALYEDRKDAARLVDLYRRRVELCGEDDGDLKHRLLLDAARCYEVGLNDRREAVVLLGQALETKPGDAEVMQRLSGLYEAEKMWPELLDNLRAQVEKETDPAARAVLTRRIGKLLASELDDHAKALEAFREVLAHGYDEEAARAVRDIGESRDELRREAADILEPVLRAAAKYEALADALEMRLRAQTEPIERAATLRAVAVVSETSLSDLGKAETALLRALAEQPQDTELHTEIERVAALLGKPGWERYADALGERAASIFDAKITAELFSRLGKVAENELGELPRAAEAYARAAEQGGDTPEVLTALERVHGGLEDTRALVDVIERRIAIESGAAEQADLYHRLASLQIGALEDKAQGLATLRLALERVPEHEKSRAFVEKLLDHDALFDDAFDTLEGVYRSTNRGADLGRLYAKRVGRAEGVRARTRARLELAKVLENEGADAAAAQRAVEAAVTDDPQEADALAELERLAEKTGNWSGAADALAKALEAQDRAAKADATGPAAGSGGELWARLGKWRRDRVGDPRGAESAFTRALDLDPENVELVRGLEELTRAPGRERDRIAVLRRLGRLEGEPERKRELAREAVEMAENIVADPRLAEEVLRELLADNDGDAWAAEELTRLRQDAGDHAEVVTLLLRRAEGEADVTKAIELRHRAAEVAAGKLDDRDRAIALYEEILEQEPTDARAQERLRALYGELGKYNELAKLLQMLVDNATTVESRAALRIDLAKLQLEKFENPRDAADTLRAVLDEDPDHDGAARALAAIYEKDERFNELAELWGRLVERARVRGDAVLELDRMITLAEIVEERVKDAGAALKAYEDVLEKDPVHRDALDAVARLAEARSAWEKAASALAKMLETASGDEAVSVALRLAKAREELGDDAGVEQALKRALEANPKQADVRTRLAQLYEKTKSWAELAQLLVGNADILRDENPYEPPILELPTSPRGSAPPGGSVAPAGVASMPPPPGPVTEQVKLLRRAAQIHLAERRAADDAVPLFERATKLVPHDRELLLLLCDAYTAAKRDRDAAAVLERVIASFGNKRTKELSLYHHRLGRALASLGDKDVALTQLDMAFKIDPGSIEVLRDLGVLALEANDLDRAQKTFRALLLQRLDAQSGISKGEVFYYLGEICMKQGDKAKAVQMLERAVENEPSLTRAKAMLSDLKS